MCIGLFSSVLGDKEFDDPKLAEQKQWLDAEMDKILEQRKQMEILDKVFTSSRCLYSLCFVERE